MTRNLELSTTAEDFAAAFGVGENDTTISTVDADGVVLAAIQGLYQENQQLKRDLCTFDILLSNFYLLISLSPPLGPTPTPLTSAF